MLNEIKSIIYLQLRVLISLSFLMCSENAFKDII